MTPIRETTQALFSSARPHPGWLLAALTWCYQTLAFYLVLTIFGVVFVAWNIVAMVLCRLRPWRSSARFGQLGIMHLSYILLAIMHGTGLAKFDLAELDSLREEGGLVLVPNHPTLIDVLLVTSRLPRIVCITKASLWDNPACGAAARLAGYIRNDAPHRLVRAAASAVAAGNQLLIFPEGTRTRMVPVGPFKGGFALMASQAGVPVQTVLLRVDPPYLAKGWGFFRRPAFPVRYQARLGRRFVVDAPAKAFAERLEAYFDAELNLR